MGLFNLEPSWVKERGLLEGGLSKNSKLFRTLNPMFYGMKPLTFYINRGLDREGAK